MNKLVPPNLGLPTASKALPARNPSLSAIHFSPRQQLLTLVASVAVFFTIGIGVSQAQQTWNNSSPNKNWSNNASTWNAGDWWANTTGTLYFDTAGSGNVTNNMTDWLSFSLVFNSGAASFTNSGNSINVQGKIENNSTNTQTISFNNISAANGVKELNPVNGDLVINSTNLYLGTGGGGEWRVWGANGKTLTINGVISENGTFRINQNSTVVFQKTNTYSGQTYIHHGQLIISNGASAGTNTINLGGTNTIGVSATNALYLGTASSSGGVTNGSAISVNTGGGASTLGGNNTSGTNEFSGGITLNQGATLTASSGGTLSVSGVISGAGGFTNSGAGTVIFSGSGANTASGGSTISAGTTVFNKSANTAAIGGALTVNSGATLRTDAANQLNNQFVTVNGTLNMNSQAQSLALAGAGTVTMNATLTNNSTGTDTFSGKLTSSGALVKTNTGTLILSGSANDYTGATTVGGGTLAVSTNNALGATNAGTTIGSGGTLDLRSVTYSTAEAVTNNGGTIAASTGTSSYAGGITLGANSTFDVGGTQLTLGGVIDDGASTFGITKSGSGVLILTNANTYDGNTTIGAGTILVGTNTAFGATGTVSVTAGARLQLSNNLTIARNLTLNGAGISGSGALQNVSGSNTVNAPVVLGSGTRINTDGGSLTMAADINGGANVLYIGGVSNTLISGKITNSAGGAQDGTTTSVFKDGAGTLTFSGPNTYTGDTRISAGNVTVAAGGNLGSGSDVFIASGGSLAITTNTAVASLQEWESANGGTANLGAGATLTVNGDAYSSYMNSISGSGGLTKSGSGTMNLYGTQNVSGSVAVSGGELNSSVALAATNFAVSGGLLGSTAASVFADSANFVLTGTGTLRIGGSDTVGTISGASTTAVTVTNGTLTTTYASGSNSLASTISGAGNFAKAGTGTLSLTGTAAGIGSVAVTAGRLQVGDNGTAGTIGSANAAVSEGAQLAFYRSDNVGYGGIVSGAGGLAQLGASTLTLSGANTYSGPTTIGAGTIFATNGSALSDSSTVSIESAGTLALGSDETVGSIAGSGALALGSRQLIAGGNGASTTFSGAASGNGSVVKQGAGTLSFSGANTFTGGFFIDNGAVELAGGSFAGGAIEIGGGVAGGAQPGNSAKLLISTNTTLSRNITVNAETNNVGATGLRTIEFANAASTIAFLSGTLSLERQVFVSVANGATGSLSGVISGAGSIVKQGVGTLALSGANTFTNGLYIDAGTADLAGGSLAAGVIEIGGGVPAGSVNSSDAKLRVSSNASFVRNITVNAETNASGVSGNRAIEFANAPSTTATLSGTLVLEKSSSVDVAADATGVLSGAISGAGGLTKGGNGTLTFSGANPNTYAGTTTVNAGTLRLAKNAGVNAIAGAVAVNAGATLLLSANDNVTNTSTVTLSGGTISRSSGVSETFGDLNLTANSFLNYGSVAESKLIQFGSLSMGAFTLGVTGFADMNQLAYAASSLADGQSKLSSFTFDNSYTTSFSGSTFTITAIPEASTLVAVLGLLALCGFPLMRGRSRRNLR